ncbi:MAG: hypothetical protein V4699_03550 [Patescibacteria group bacterium]
MKCKSIFVAILLLGLVTVVSAETSSDYGGSRSIRLREGWNLATIYAIPIEDIFKKAEYPESSAAVDLYSGIGAIFFYDRYNSEYIRMYPEPESVKISQLLKNVGDPEKGGDTGEYGAVVNSSVWIYSEKDQTLNYNAVDGPLQHKYVNIQSGWNFLSVTPEYIGKTLNQLKGSCNFMKIYSYSRDGGRSSWVDMLNDTNFFNNEKFDESSVGAGFVIKVTNSCKMGTTASVPTVPSFPN